MTLDAYLEAAAARRFDDGAVDCGLSLADWVIAARGCADPAAHLRGRYRTALGRARLLKRAGGLVAVVTDCADRAGLEPTANPVRGDVAVIEVQGVEYGAIHLGQRWAVQADGIVALTPDRVIAAWRV